MLCEVEQSTKDIEKQIVKAGGKVEDSLGYGKTCEFNYGHVSSIFKPSLSQTKKDMGYKVGPKYGWKAKGRYVQKYAFDYINIYEYHAPSMDSSAATLMAVLFEIIKDNWNINANQWSGRWALIGDLNCDPNSLDVKLKKTPQFNGYYDTTTQIFQILFPSSATHLNKKTGTLSTLDYVITNCLNAGIKVLSNDFWKVSDHRPIIFSFSNYSSVYK